MAPRGPGRARLVRRLRPGGGRLTASLFPFPSPEWVSAYGAAINASAAYRAASLEWHHGPVALVVTPAAGGGGAPGAAFDPVGIWLDLDGGACRAARVVQVAEAQAAAFVLTAEYRYWKQIIRRELGPIAGIMQRKIGLVGSLPIVVRFVKSAEALVDAATTVPTRFLDE